MFRISDKTEFFKKQTKATLLKIPASRNPSKITRKRRQLLRISIVFYLAPSFSKWYEIPCKYQTSKLLRGKWEGTFIFSAKTQSTRKLGTTFFDKATQLQYLVTSFLTKKRWLKLFAISKATVRRIILLRTTAPENVEGLKKINNLFLEEKIDVSPWKQAKLVFKRSYTKYRKVEIPFLKIILFRRESRKRFRTQKTVLPRE